MTPISKPVTRVSIYPYRGRFLVATLGPGDVLYLREKGRHEPEAIDLLSCYHLAVKRRVMKERFDKAQARKGKRS
jgi:hypothetical protein